MKKTMTIEMAAGGYIGEEKFFAMLELRAKHHEIQDACHKLRITANRAANPRMDVCSCEILPELTEEEQAVFRRGRNANVNTIPRHASRAQYSTATALEALLGWLYLRGDKARVNELFCEMMKVEG